MTAIDSSLDPERATVPTASDAFAAAPWPAAIVDADLLVLRTNDDLDRRFGNLAGACLLDVLTATSHDEVRGAVAQVLADPNGSGVESYVRVLAGWPAQLHLSRCADGYVSAWLRPAFDDARQNELLRAHGQRFEALAANAPAGILCAESGLRVDFVNDRCGAVFGTRNADDLWGFGWLDYLAEPADVARATESMDLAVNGETVGPVELRVRQPDGTLRTVEARFAPIGVSGGGFVATVEDVTDARALAALLEAQAVRDPLTGLSNRRSMERAINALIERGAGPSAAIIFLDLDNFKDINDTLGHTAGDEMLIEVGRRMAGCVREGDMVARFGGDEFVVLLPGRSNAEAVAERLVRAVSAPTQFAGHETAITASAGIVPFGEATDAEDLLRQADIAMYQAKRAGKNRAKVFDPAARDDDERRLAVTLALRRALSAESDDIDVHYQPICAADGTTHGVEALLRWTDAELGSVSPAEFVPIAESAGLVDHLGALVRERAFADLATWLAAGWSGHLSINLSAREFTNPSLMSVMAEQLERHGVPPRSIVVELTETTVMGDVGEAQRILSSIAAHGMQVAIDDFGTGYSSLAHLRRFPVAVIKVDREFVSAIESSEEDRAICASIVALAVALDLSVVAEGVETVGQRDAMADLGVELMQGWLFSRPLTRDAIPAFLGI